MTPIKPLIAGNWKMNGLGAALNEANAFCAGFDAVLAERVDAMICPPATLLSRVAELLENTPITCGGQDCHENDEGAFTGDLSAPMIKDAGASAVILGHSERRTLHGETDALVQKKVLAAQKAGLQAIICVGETFVERDSGKTLERITAQLEGSLPEGVNQQNTVIAYEPVWAIGTGKIPNPEDIVEVHTLMRTRLTDRFGAQAAHIRLLYGGSLKPSNAQEILALEHVNGGLVGGASLKADDFLSICKAA